MDIPVSKVYNRIKTDTDIKPITYMLFPIPYPLIHLSRLSQEVKYYVAIFNLD